MNNQNALTTFAAAIGTAALMLTSMAVPAAAELDETKWKPYGQALVLDRSYATQPVEALGSRINSQKLSNSVRLNFYKAQLDVNDGFDYYLVTGNSGHGVASYQTAASGLVKAWYGDNMSVILTGRLPNGGSAQRLESQPSSTQTISNQGFSFNLGLGPDGPSGSFGYSNTISAPDVMVGSAADASSVTYNVALPGVSVNRLNPGKSSWWGMTGFNFAATFRVLRGTGFSLSLAESMQWDMFASFRVVASEMNVFYSNVVVDFADKQVRDELGRCLTIQGAQAVMSPCQNGAPLQKWTYTAESQVRNEATGTCLDYQGTAGNDTPVVTMPCTDASSQKWSVRSTGGLLLMNKLWSISGFVAAPAAQGKTATGTSVMKLAPESTNTMITVR